MDKLANIRIPSVRIGEMSVASRGQQLRTLLGSCVGLVLYDSRQQIGGLAHIVLPRSRKTTDTPGKFVDTAVPQLIQEMKQLAVAELNLFAKLAGGASMFATTAKIDIGRQNTEACIRLLEQLEIPIIASHCGGVQGRRLTFDSANGAVLIEVVGQAVVEI